MSNLKIISVNTRVDFRFYPRKEIRNKNIAIECINLEIKLGVKEKSHRNKLISIKIKRFRISAESN